MGGSVCVCVCVYGCVYVYVYVCVLRSGPKMVSRRSKLFPEWSQMAPGWSRNSLEMVSDGPRWSQHGPNVPGWIQGRPRPAPGSGQDRSRMVQGRPRIAPGSAAVIAAASCRGVAPAPYSRALGKRHGVGSSHRRTARVLIPLTSISHCHAGAHRPTGAADAARSLARPIRLQPRVCCRQ